MTDIRAVNKETLYFDRCLNFCRVFTELAESTLDAVLAAKGSVRCYKKTFFYFFHGMYVWYVSREY